MLRERVDLGTVLRYLAWVVEQSYHWSRQDRRRAGAGGGREGWEEMSSLVWRGLRGRGDQPTRGSPVHGDGDRGVL